MANNGIKEIKVSNTNYLIEPTLYASATLESGKTSDYVATLNNFELFTGVAVNVSFAANVVANATLNINETGAINIKYADVNIKADVLLENHIYTFVYNGTNWALIGETSSGRYLPLTGGTVTGDVSVKKLTITDTNAQGHLIFSRNGTSSASKWNYILFPNSAYTGIAIGTAASSASSTAIFTKTAVYPGETEAIDLGTTNNKWNVVYAKNFKSDNFSTSGTNGILAYHPTTWTGVTSSQWGAGTVDSQGVIRSNNTDLIHYRSGATTTNSVILDSANFSTYAAAAAHEHSYIGKQYFIAYPSDGHYESGANSGVTGYIKIKIPQATSETMFSFDVDIYNYADNATTRYHISGYNYKSSPWWYNCTAYCIAPITNSKANLSVRFLADGTNSYVTIGEVDTSWSYPNVNIHNISMGRSNATLAKWKSGWETTLVTTAFDATVKKTIQNTNIAYGNLPLTGGALTGDLILKTSSGDSPKITFLRGDTNTNNNNSLVDWTVYDKAGVLTFYSDYTNNMNKSIVEFYAAGAETPGILPGDDAIYSLGSSGRKWSDVYATTFHGTATRATADASGNEIASTYAKLASPAFTGTPTAPTAEDNTNNTQIATTAFVMSAFKANDAMLYKGVVNANSDLPSTHSQGWTYKVGTAGEYAGIQCEVGDMIICNTDGTAANNDHWNVIQTNIDGAVVGPASSTNNAIARFDGTTGRIIKNSSAILDDTTCTLFLGTNTGTSSTTMGGNLESKYTLYLRSGVNLAQTGSTSIIFQRTTKVDDAITAVENARFNTSGDFLPGVTNTQDIGSSSLVWQNVYATTFNGAATAVKIGSRITNATTAHNAADYSTIKTYLVSTKMTSNKPLFSTHNETPATHDGYLIDFHWDNSGDYRQQLAVSNAIPPGLTIRGKDSSTWSDWYPIITTANIGTGTTNGTIKMGGTEVAVAGLGSAAYAETADFASSTHDHDGIYLPLTGGTVTGDIILASRDETSISSVFKRKVAAKKANGSGWARVGFSFIDNNDEEFARIGVYGTGETFNYLYIGTGGYNASNNIRIDGSGNIIQPAGYIMGEQNANPNHAIKLGHASSNLMNFYEYGGVFNWYKSISGTNTLLMNLTDDTLTVANLVGNASSATKVAATLASTTKLYLLGASTTLTATAANVDLKGDTGVYLTTSEGTLSAGIYSWNVSGTEKAHTVYNTTDDTIDFVFD